MSNNTNGQPVRGVSTIRAELNEARNDNTYKLAFKALGAAVVCTLLSYAGYQFLDTIYVWLWVITGIAWIVGIGLLVFGKSIEDDRHEKIAKLEAELAKAQAARDYQPKAVATTHGTEAPAAPVRPKIQVSVGGAASAPTSGPVSAPAPTLIPAPAMPMSGIMPQATIPTTPPSNMPNAAPVPPQTTAHPKESAPMSSVAPTPTGWVRRTASATPSASTSPTPATPTQPRFCGHCGKPIEGPSRFCGYCGQPL